MAHSGQFAGHSTCGELWAGTGHLVRHLVGLADLLLGGAASRGWRLAEVRAVIANIAALRQARGVSWRQLSERLAGLGHPIIGLSRPGRGEGRITVDDLVALAEVLGVTPDVLLSPPEAVRAGPAAVPAALREVRNLVS